MPYKKKRIMKRRKPSKRIYRRRRKFTKTKYTNRAVKVGGSLPLPDKYTCKQRYIEDSLVIDPSGVVPSVYTFRANSLYDPNFTGTGHQPLGFDQIMPMYNHYCVIGSRIKAQFFNGDTTGGLPTVCGIFMTGNQSPPLTSWQALAEQGNITYGYVRANPNNVNDMSTELTLTKTFSAKKYFGGKNILTDKFYSGTDSTNPGEQAYFHIFVCPADNATNTGNIRLQVEIEYITVYHEAKQLAQS